jgi:trypsin
LSIVPFFFSLLLGVLAGAPSRAIAEGTVVGGVVVTDPADAPFIANLGECGGTIVNDRWILTAGHCEDVKVVLLGSYDAQAGVAYEIEKDVVHPKYELRDIRALYDFRLLKLKKKITFTDRIRPVRLATPEFEKSGGMAPGRVATTYGWGAKVPIIPVGERAPGKYDPALFNFERYLRRVDLPILARSVVNQWIRESRRLDGTMLAAGYRKGGKDNCYGDSGGPLVVRDPARGGERVQIGIVSWGFGGCAQPKKPSVYANVAWAYPWVMKVLVEE